VHPGGVPKTVPLAAAPPQGAVAGFEHPKDASAPGEDRAVAPVLVQGPLVFNDLGKFFGTKSVACEEGPVADWAKGKERIVGLAKWNAVPHPLSHATREAATLQAYSIALDGLREASILSIYGADRDVRLAKLTGFEIGGRKLACEEGVRVTVTCGPDEVYPGDAGKTGLRSALNGPYDCVVMVDVYWDGAKGRVSPEMLARYCKLSRKGEVYVITRMFSGLAGCDDVPGYKGEVEGVWIKDVDGLVSFSPDRAGFGYPKHYDVEWMRNKAFGGLSCTYLRSVGPFELIKVAMDGVMVIPVPTLLQTLSLGRVELVEIPRPGFYFGLARFVGLPTADLAWWPGLLRNWTEHTFKSPVHSATLAALRPIYQLKTGGGHNVDMAVAMSKTMILEDPMIQHVSSRYPMYVEELIWGTGQALVFSTKTSVANRYGSLRGDHNEAESTLLKARAVSWIPSPSRYKRALVACLVVWGVVQWSISLGAHGHVLLPSGEVAVNSEWWGGLIVLGFVILAHLARRFRIGPQRGLFDAWLNRREDSMEEAVSGEMGFEVLTAGIGVPAENVRAMETAVGLGEIEVMVDGTRVGVQEAFELLKDDEITKESYVVAITNGMLHQPDRSDVNLLAAVVQRLHVSVNSAAADAWLEIFDMVSQMVPEGVHEPWALERCAEALGGVKAKNLLESWDQVVLGQISKSKKKIMVKWNETIAWKLISHVLTVKPRAITLLSNELHSWFSPDARGFSDVLHCIFDGRLFDGIRVYYASGYSGQALDALGGHLYGYEDFIAASGDDSIVCFFATWRNTQWRFAPLAEGDFSAMDQSEKLDALMHHASLMAKFGVPKFAIDMAMDVSGLPYTASGKRLKIKGSVGHQLATGIDYTTPFNSLTTICFWLYVRAHRDESPEDLAAKLGLKLKLVTRHEANLCTFLKGWWQPGKEGGVYWYPLPSQVVKLGKIMREPRLFDLEGRQALKGVQIAAWAIAQSMPTLPRDYPVLGAFLSMLERCGARGSATVSASEDGWYKPMTTGMSIDRGYVLDSLCARYGITSEMVNECEALMLQVQRLPVFMVHDVFVVLSRVDYG
jgi:hypothetical protein